MLQVHLGWWARGWRTGLGQGLAGERREAVVGVKKQPRGTRREAPTSSARTTLQLHWLPGTFMEATGGEGAQAGEALTSNSAGVR